MPNPTNAVNHPNKPSPPSRKTPQQMRDDMQDARLAILEKNQERQNKRTNAVMALMSLQSFVRARSINWQIAAKHIGSAYVIAYNKHKEILGKKSAKDALNIQIVFSILTVVSAGSLAWVGLSDRFTNFSKVLADSVEDAAQAGIGEVLSAVGPISYAAHFPPIGGPVGVEPQIYQNNLEIKVLSATRSVEEDFKKIIDDLKETQIEKWDIYDEKKQKKEHDKWIKTAAQFGGAEDLPIGPDGQPDVQMMANELERAIWAKYVLSQYYYRDFGIFKTDSEYEYVGDEVYDRLAELGVTKKRNEVENDLWNSKSLPERAKKDQDIYINFLVKWARNFEPKPFATMRREQEKFNAGMKEIARPILRYFGTQRGR